MQGIPSRLMIAALAAYASLRILSTVSANVAASPLRTHGADVLAPLVLIPLFAWLQVLWGLRSPHQALGAREIFLYVAGFSVVYELILPACLPLQVGDPLDVAAYLIGGAVLWLVPLCLRRCQGGRDSVAGLHLRTAASRR